MTDALIKRINLCTGTDTHTERSQCKDAKEENGLVTGEAHLLQVKNTEAYWQISEAIIR